MGGFLPIIKSLPTHLMMRLSWGCDNISILDLVALDKGFQLHKVKICNHIWSGCVTQTDGVRGSCDKHFWIQIFLIYLFISLYGLGGWITINNTVTKIFIG